MIFDMPTVRTLADICSKNTGFAVHDGISSFDLLRMQLMKINLMQEMLLQINI